MSPLTSALALVLALAASADGSALRSRGQQPGTATAMAGIEGQACGQEEHQRYMTIVCQVEHACGCSGTVCELDWCSTYVHEWKKDFGACVLKGCPPPVSQ
mmetsp:Transcript_118188/g.339062  ORF Transcript_118188/g.339062 Transcript_118188/m.339062 type:complete len:101 (-) Transcript_118188:63-365(-)